MVLSMFNRKAPAPTVSLARVAFNDARRAYLEKSRQRLETIEQAANLQRHKSTADAAARTAAILRAALDETQAAILLGAPEPPDLEARKQELADAEQDAAKWEPIGRAAEIAHRRFSAQAADLTREALALYAPIGRLAHPVLYEDALHELAAEFREKEEAFREIHRRVFVVARASDKLAQAEVLGLFRGSAEYDFLHITRPEHPEYQRGPTDPWTIKLEADADAMALDAEAAKLLHELLTAEPA